MSLIFRVSSVKAEGALQVSKWHKIQVLLSAEEMQELIATLGEVFFVCVSQPVVAEEAFLTAAQFCSIYLDYIQRLKEGDRMDLPEFRKWFSSAMTSDLATFFALPVGEKYLIKPTKPVIQLQAHHFFYSDLDKKFHPMVLSPESISWGLQFSYPRLFQDPKTHRIGKVTETQEFPNSALFSKLLKWMRSATLPTPFVVGGMRTNSSIRVGKKALPAFKDHPQLTSRGISIHEY